MRWLIDDEADGDDGIVAAVVMMMVLVVACVIATVAMTVLTVLVGGGAGVDGNGGWRYGTAPVRPESACGQIHARITALSPGGVPPVLVASRVGCVSRSSR